mmetsp:Transcript_31511/g.57919  ORF Transcript_31511/g.57919 Transcript_31511/m.57919 type:complete len:132 (+) Transcript_31511:99-494(+)
MLSWLRQLDRSPSSPMSPAVSAGGEGSPLARTGSGAQSPSSSPARSDTSQASSVSLSPFLTVALQQLRSTAEANAGTEGVPNSPPTYTDNENLLTPQRRKSGSSRMLGSVERSAKRRSLGSGGPIHGTFSP